VLDDPEACRSNGASRLFCSLFKREKAEMTPFQKQEAVCKGNIHEAERELGCPEGTPVYDSAYRTKVRPWKVSLRNLYLDHNIAVCSGARDCTVQKPLFKCASGRHRVCREHVADCSACATEPSQQQPDGKRLLDCRVKIPRHGGGMPLYATVQVRDPWTAISVATSQGAADTDLNWELAVVDRVRDTTCRK
jgi:hypothetical protein